MTDAVSQKQGQTELTVYGTILLFAFAGIYIYSFQFHAGMPLRSMPVVQVTTLLMTAGAAFLAIIANIQIGRIKLQRQDWVFLTLLGLACRIAMIAAPPVKENDMFRYMLDGNMTLRGINPYAVEPNQILTEESQIHPATARAREVILKNEAAERIIGNINYPHFRTIYPPLTQAFFAISQILSPWKTVGWQAILAFADLLTALLLLRLLSGLGMPSHNIFIYWLNPVIFKEIHNSLHMDALIYPFVVGALHCMVHSWLRWGALLIAAATCLKFWPAILFPAMCRPYLRNWRLLLTPALIFCLTTTLLLTPMLLAPVNQSSGVVAFANYWMMNDAIFHLSAYAILATKFFTKAVTVKIVKGLFAIAILAYMSYALRTPPHAPAHQVHQIALILYVMVIFLPTQFPWYYSWVIPLLVLRPQASMLTYSMVIHFYYFRFYLQAHGQAGWFDNLLAYFEHLPVYLIIIWEVYKGRWNPAQPLAYDAFVNSSVKEDCSAGAALK